MIDSDDSSLTITWPEVPKARRYMLEYVTNASGARSAASDGEDENYQVLSDKLTGTQVKKRNLSSNEGPFIFRVRARDEIDFVGDAMYSDPLELLDEGVIRMEAPEVKSAGSNAVIITWGKSSSTAGDDMNNKCKYEIQMRQINGGTAWETIASDFSGNAVKKNNLVTGMSYQFRVKADDSNLYSVPSNAVEVFSISPGMKKLFMGLERNELLCNSSQKISLSDAISGKIVLFYISAHWCGPCRQFTPQLAKFYEANKNDIEIVFLSADHDEDSFLSYFRTMPWKAVPYDSTIRETLQAQFRVNSIPRLIVFNKDGVVIENNAVGKPLNVMQWKRS